MVVVVVAAVVVVLVAVVVAVMGVEVAGTSKCVSDHVSAATIETLTLTVNVQVTAALVVVVRKMADEVIVG
jgi:hypothetical protein